MLSDFVPAHHETLVEFFRVFDDGRGNGCWFPCDKGGGLSPLNPAAQANYERCLASPGDFLRYNEVVEQRRSVFVPGRGRCSCGAEVELVDQFCGACQCGSCGQWYSVSGEPLLPPSMWEEPIDEDPW